MLKFKVEKLDDVEEAHRGLYEEKEINGKKWFILKLEGAVDKDRVTELQTKLSTFRKNNTNLANLLKSFATHTEIELEDNITVEDLGVLLKEKADELAAKLKAGAGGAAPTKEELEKLVTERVDAYKKTTEAQINKLKKENEILQTTSGNYFKSLEKLTIENEVLQAAQKRGLKASAQLDIVARARSIFRYAEGKVRALADDGETPIYGPDGTNELTISEWVDLQATKDAPHLFESNSGGGASGGSGGAGRNGGPGPNPWKKETFNLTRQMELTKRDPTAARRLEAEATGR